MECDMALLEIFETRGSKRLLRPPTERPGTCREAVVGWAQDLSEADRAPFEVTFQHRMHGHELYVVRVGKRTFSVVVH